MNINLDFINFTNKFILQNFRVDFTFLNTVNQKNMYARLKKRKKLNRYDKFDYNFYSKVQKGFIKLAQKKSKKYMIINSNLETKINKVLIIKKIDKLIK